MLPRKLETVDQALVSFQTYLTAMYEEQKRAFAAGEEESDHNLMTLLVLASAEEAAAAAADGPKEGSGGLTESEIYGTMFTFNFAGHDTTAHSTTLVGPLLPCRQPRHPGLGFRRDPDRPSRPKAAPTGLPR